MSEFDDEPLPAAQKRYLAAFDAYVRAWADDDEDAMLEYSLQRAELLPAALGKPLSVIGVIPRGSAFANRDGDRAVTLVFTG